MSEEIQEPNTPNKLSTKKSLILGCIIFCLGLLIIEAIKINYQVTNKYGSWNHYWEHVRLNREKPNLAEELDAARDAYKYTVENSVLYMIRDGDYVESVTAEVVYDDIRSAETTAERIGSWCNLDKAYVTVQLDTSFNSIPDLDKCNMLLKIQDEIEHNLSELYYGSSYYQMFEQYKYQPRDSIEYKDHYLWIEYTQRCTFTAGTTEYSPGTYMFSVIKNNRYTFYNCRESHGEVVKLIKYDTGTIEADGSWTSDSEKKKSKDTTTTNSSGSKDTNSSGKKDTTGSSSGSYDPYDVHDYDSADDFADDKYEEFYDYEDEYEDEDEAYDAAEDYWYDEY